MKFYFPLKEGMLQIFIALQIHRLSWVWTHEPWVQWEAH
jgi:hypothetical protein